MSINKLKKVQTIWKIVPKTPDGRVYLDDSTKNLDELVKVAPEKQLFLRLALFIRIFVLL